MAFDVAIRNRLAVGGTGSPPFGVDAGVSEGRIVDVGTISDSATEEIDAEGYVVTPGFVDGHTNMGAQIFWDPIGSCSCWHGATSVVMGKCGFTLALAKEFERELVVRNLERVEDISSETLAALRPPDAPTARWSVSAGSAVRVAGVNGGLVDGCELEHTLHRQWVCHG